jgi:hypothetical protein
MLFYFTWQLKCFSVSRKVQVASYRYGSKLNSPDNVSCWFSKFNQNSFRSLADWTDRKKRAPFSLILFSFKRRTNINFCWFSFQLGSQRFTAQACIKTISNILTCKPFKFVSFLISEREWSCLSFEGYLIVLTNTISCNAGVRLSWRDVCK